MKLGGVYRVMKNLIYLFFFVGGISLSAQSIDVKITDQNGRPLVGAILINYLGQEYGPSNSEGLIFGLSADAGSLFQVFKEGYYIRVVEVDWQKLNSSPLVLKLEPNDMTLLEVDVSAEKISFADTLRVQDIDLHQETILVLGYDYIVLSDLELQAKLSVPNRAKFKSIERDPRGNLFLLSKDSVSQVLVRDDYLYFYQAVALEQYQRFIKPIAAEIGEALVLRNLQPEQIPLPISEFRPGNRGKAMTFPPFHNQGVQFFIHREGQEAEPFYFSADTNAVLLAHSAFMDAFNIAAAIEKLYDKHGILNHRKLIELDEAQKIYRNAYAKDLPIPIFEREGHYLLFDRFQDEVVVFNSRAEEIERHPFVIDKDYVDPLLIQDYQSGALYALKDRRGMVSIYPIEGYRLGTAQKLVLFARETKVLGEQVFFIDESNYLVAQKLN